jgi:uncharacterized membrane protein
MAVILYKGPNKTVATIAARNAIAVKHDSMVVTVLDAIADPAAGAGIATFRWVESTSAWILVSKSGVESINFETEELLISNGSVTPSNVAISGNYWNIVVVNGDVIQAELKLENLTSNLNSISGLDDYNGLSLRVTYAYGTVGQQVTDYVDFKAAEIQANLDGFSGTVAEFEAEL